MKRAPLKRGKGLKRATKPMARKARLKARKTPRAFRQRREPRYAVYVRAQRCILWNRARRSANGQTIQYHVCIGPTLSGHVKSRGSGGDDRENLYPGCAAAHEQQHLWGIRTFEAEWGLDLKQYARELDRAYQRETGAL